VSKNRNNKKMWMEPLPLITMAFIKASGLCLLWLLMSFTGIGKDS